MELILKFVEPVADKMILWCKSYLQMIEYIHTLSYKSFLILVHFDANVVCDYQTLHLWFGYLSAIDLRSIFKWFFWIYHLQKIARSYIDIEIKSWLRKHRKLIITITNAWPVYFLFPNLYMLALAQPCRFILINSTIHILYMIQCGRNSSFFPLRIE